MENVKTSDNDTMLSIEEVPSLDVALVQSGTEFRPAPDAI